MAIKRHQVRTGALWPGMLVAGLLLAITGLTFATLIYHTPSSEIKTLWDDSYLWHILTFTFWQALLSTLLSVLPAIFLAQALYRRRFVGRNLMLRLYNMTLVLPTLVAIVGILSIYGRQGWLPQLLSWIGIEYHFSPFGLSGILLAHVFFNLPLATRLLLQALDSIATPQRQLAAQLGMSFWQRFRWLEWPHLRRQIFPASTLIFTLCFASFTTVLILGGGPRATTIELAIYQSLYIDFDLQRAALLAFIQLICSLTFIVCSQHLNGSVLPVDTTQQPFWHDLHDSGWLRISDTLLITLALLLLVPPLLAVVTAAINPALLTALQQATLWQAFFNSLIIALSAGFLCVLLTMLLLWSSREFRARQQITYAYWLEMSGMLILALPSSVLATSFFLLLHSTLGLRIGPYSIVILTNALLALPFALKTLKNPMHDLAIRYNHLCLSLGLQGWKRLYWLELRALKIPLANAFAFATVLSIGDFGVIALFGNEKFSTLPFYLYQQIGAYRGDAAAVTALLLLLLCFLLFTTLERLAGRHAHT